MPTYTDMYFILISIFHFLLTTNIHKNLYIFPKKKPSQGPNFINVSNDDLFLLEKRNKKKHTFNIYFIKNHTFRTVVTALEISQDWINNNNNNKI